MDLKRLFEYHCNFVMNAYSLQKWKQDELKEIILHRMNKEIDTNEHERKEHFNSYEELKKEFFID
jgi:hypothetical protein